MCYEHQTCTDDFSKDSTTMQYLKCWVVTTSGISGNSIKYHTLNYYGTQILLMDNFNLLYGAHPPGGFMLLGVTQGVDFNFLVVSTISEVFR